MTRDPDTTKGTLIDTNTGPAIEYDETGLRMRLSDDVINDINNRTNSWIDSAVLGDIDAFGLCRSGEWYIFDARLPGKQGQRRFRRRIDPVADLPPDIIADPTGALFSILSLGGTRRAKMSAELLDFPYHILTFDDGFDAGGSLGTDPTPPFSQLARVRTPNHDSLIADALLDLRFQEMRSLPLIVTRSVATNTTRAGDFFKSPALEEFHMTVQNLKAAAQELGVPAKVLGVGLDFAMEDTLSTSTEWKEAVFEIMDKVSEIFSSENLRKPLFFMNYDCGTMDQYDTPALRAQHDLLWDHGGHSIIFTSPSYMYAQDAFGRLTSGSAIAMARMDAYALEACNQDKEWHCPRILLAERSETDPTAIICRLEVSGSLLIDPDALKQSGPSAGFCLIEDESNAKITEVSVSKTDPSDVIVKCSTAPTGPDLTLGYVIGPNEPSGKDRRRIGALRDDWQDPMPSKALLRRWALPAAIKVTG